MLTSRTYALCRVELVLILNKEKLFFQNSLKEFFSGISVEIDHPDLDFKKLIFSSYRLFWAL